MDEHAIPDGALNRHYGPGGLIDAVRRGIERLGKSTATVALDDLAPLDEFHVGGREASQALLDPLAFSTADRVLDVGCGLGGTARYVAQRYGCRVTGVDLTSEFVETGRELNAWLGLEERVTLHHGDALALPFAGASFDAAYLLHVGMNIADKGALFAEIARVLRPGGKVALYDLVLSGEGDITYPVPWASEAAMSFVAPPEAYRAALNAAGCEVVLLRDRRDYALQFFDAVRAKARHSDGPPPLGLHLVMGELAGTKYRNMIEAIIAGVIAPVEIVATRV